MKPVESAGPLSLLSRFRRISRWKPRLELSLTFEWLLRVPRVTFADAIHRGVH